MKVLAPLNNKKAPIRNKIASALLALVVLLTFVAVVDPVAAKGIQCSKTYNANTPYSYTVYSNVGAWFEDVTFKSANGARYVYSYQSAKLNSNLISFAGLGQLSITTSIIKQKTADIRKTKLSGTKPYTAYY